MARVQDRASGRPAPALTPFVAGYQGYRLAGVLRDFRQFAGAPPSRWLAEEVRNVQVTPPAHLAGSMP